MNVVRRLLPVGLIGFCLWCAAADYDRFEFLKRSWDSYLRSLDEPGLCELRRDPANGQVYRLIHAPPFDLPTVVVLEIPVDESPTVTAKRGGDRGHNGTGSSPPEVSSTRLDDHDVQSVLRQLQGIDFWNAESRPQPVEDGTFIYLEGVQDGSCHHHIWISPQDKEVKELTNSLLALARFPRQPSVSE